MAQMQLRIDSTAFDRDTQAAIRRSPQVAAQALRIEQLSVARESAAEVPVDTGILRASRQEPLPFRRGSTIVAVIEYTALYALSVHENPRSGQTGGVSPSGSRRNRFARVGKWKYLEHPMQRAQAGYEQRVGRFILRNLIR